MTEDDTFEALKRTPFVVMNTLYEKNNLDPDFIMHDEIYHEFFAQHNWTEEMFFAELEKRKLL